MHTLPLNDESAGECHTDDVTASHPDSRHVDGDGWDPLLISFGGHLVQEVVVRPGVLKHKQNSFHWNKHQLMFTGQFVSAATRKITDYSLMVTPSKSSIGQLFYDK